MQNDIQGQTNEAHWERVVRTARQNAPLFAALSAQERIDLLRQTARSVADNAEAWVAAGCKAKGIDPGSSTSGEEWLGGPAVVVRNCRLLAESWEKFAAGGLPHDGLPYKDLGNGTADIQVFPTSGIDKALFGGFTCNVQVEKLVGQSGPEAVSKAGRTCLVLGAGNVSSIPPMDALCKMFIEGRTCVLKMNPVNEYLGPIFCEALKPLVDAGFLSIAYGGADAGTYLCQHPDIDEIHITGSDKTHDLIVWGPPGQERDRRLAVNDPICKKPVTSELGNVSPVIITPCEYARAELEFMSKNVAAMVANNASCNCNAAKMLVTCRDWPQRRQFLTLVYEALERTPCRLPYYPGATDRYKAIVDAKGEEQVTFVGSGPEGCQRWALIAGLEPDSNDPLFSTEPFCAVLSETTIRATNVAAFLGEAVAFCNYKLWGTLNASIMIDPRTEKSKEGRRALETAIRGLRYGTVAINHWPALGYGFVSPPWGAAPHHTLTDVGSGIGWVHNTYMLRGVLKSVIRGPLVVKPKPAWFTDNAAAHEIGRKLTKFELNPSVLGLPSIIASALKG